MGEGKWKQLPPVEKDLEGEARGDDEFFKLINLAFWDVTQCGKSVAAAISSEFVSGICF